MKHIIYFLAIFLMLGVWLTSCKSITYVPVETIKHDSIYISQIKYDSIYHRDSVYYAEKGDTVYLYKYKYQYRDKLVRDTVNVTKVDSIQVLYPVEKSLTKWQKIKIELGGWAFGGVIMFVLVIVGWCVYKKIKL